MVGRGQDGNERSDSRHHSGVLNQADVGGGSVTALALDSRPVVIELHGLLRDLDSSRWREELGQGAAERLEAIRVSLREQLQSAGEPGPVWERLAELAAAVEAHLPEAVNVREDWMRFRREVWPAYEALAASLRESSVDVPSLRPTNRARSLLHMGMGLLTIAAAELLPSHQALIIAAGAGAGAGWTMELGRRLDGRVNVALMRLFGPVAHPHEANRLNSATWYATAAFLLACWGDALAGAVGLCVLAFGDPAAAMVGRRWGRTAMGRGRTLEGTLGGILAGAVAVMVFLSSLHPELSAGAVAGVAVGSASAGLLAEVGVRRLDDNFTIPLAAAAAASLVLSVLS